MDNRLNQLVAAAGAGDQTAAVGLIEQFYQRVYAFLRRRRRERPSPRRVNERLPSQQMNRTFFLGAVGVVCLAATSAALIQGRRLAGLRAEVASRQARQAEPRALAAAAARDGLPTASAGAEAPRPSTELLRLRGEVSRLSASKRQLEAARAENERLRLELAAAGTNRVPGRALPPGFVRRADAQWVGYNTPEDTMQSFLWALHHRDSARLLQALTPTAAQWFQTWLTDSSRTIEQFFQEAEAVLGMAVVGKEERPNGHVVIQVVVAPGLAPEQFHLQSIDGQWKISNLP